MDKLNCDQAIDEYLLRLPDFGSIFYALVNGWYIGQWADYSSCLADATDSQYVLATVRGNYTGDITFTRGGIGKLVPGFGTRMGLCFPKQCTEPEVRAFTEELIKGYASGAGFTGGIEVDYHLASKFDETQTDSMSAGAVIFFAIVGVALILMGIGTCVELSSCCDKPDFKGDEEAAAALYEASKFRRLEQYDKILLQRKTPTGQKLLMFSQIRNVVQLNTPQQGWKRAVKNENDEDEIRIAKNLKVFNGLKGISMLITAWGMTFFLAQYSVISNPEDVNDMQNSLFFSIVSFSVYCAPIFFFCSGFL